MELFCNENLILRWKEETDANPFASMGKKGDPDAISMELNHFWYTWHWGWGSHEQREGRIIKNPKKGKGGTATKQLQTLNFEQWYYIGKRRLVKGHFVNEVEGCLESREHKREEERGTGTNTWRNQTKIQSPQSIQEKRKEKGRHEFQQFETEETERT